MTQPVPSRPTPDERPLAACLADFWDGAFTLRPGVHRPGARPELPADAPTLPEELGPSGITAHGRDLAFHLAPLYRRLTSGD